MWRHPLESKIDCPNCNELCENVMSSNLFREKCEICFASFGQRLLKCTKSTCGAYVRVCLHCNSKYVDNCRTEENREAPLKCDSSDNTNSQLNLCRPCWIVIAIILLILGIIIAFCCNPTKTLGNENSSILERLKRDYPSQKNETWYHFLSMLEKEVPSVKSITFLHSKDKVTSDCLAKELVILYTKNKNLKSEDITFSDFNADNYGFVLEHYQSVVQKFGVFITDLDKISGNVARIFQSLCDDVSSEIKPSLFIFTLQYNEVNKTLKPIERATTVLRKAWNHLPENELAPLLSRVVRNVVDIMPEDEIKC